MQLLSGFIRQSKKFITLKRLAVTILSLVLSAIVATGCKKHSPVAVCDSSIASVQPTDITGPSTTAPGTEATFTIGYNIPSSCGTFYSLQRTIIDSLTVLSVQVKYDGCDCADILKHGQVNYVFSATQPGTYIIRVAHPPGIPLSRTVLVQ